MNNIIIVLISIIMGFFLILYGITRTEKKSNIYRKGMGETVEITDEKAFTIATKIYYSVSGCLLILFGFLLFIEDQSDKVINLCFFTFFIFQLLMQLFIRFKYCKKVKVNK